jgi:hypothetical protein
MTSAIRCPWRTCNAFDTEFHEVDARAGTEVYHCHRCGRDFHVWRTADGLGILAVVPLPTKPDDQTDHSLSVHSSSPGCGCSGSCRQNGS